MKKALLDDVSTDLTGLTAAVAGLKSSLGTNEKGEHPDVWSVIDGLDELVSDKLKSFNNTGLVKISDLEEKIGHIEELTDTFGRRWVSLSQNWLPLVGQHATTIKQLEDRCNELSATSTTAHSSNPSDVDQFLNMTNPSRSTTQNDRSADHVATLSALTSKVLKLSDAMEVLQRNRTSQDDAPSPITTRMDVLDSDLQQLNSSLENLQNRMDDNDAKHSNSPIEHFNDKPNGLGVAYKGFYFKDEDSVKQWLKANLTQPTHGLFVDLVSFSEFFGGDRYVERNTTLNDLYMTNKIGYATMSDSIVAASFQNVLPGAYGRNPTSTNSNGNSSSDLQAQPELPGLKSFKKWDNQDGSTGRKYWIKKEARSTQTQLDGMIRQQLDGDAQYLARDLLLDSMVMSEEMFNFISTSYEDTMHSGRFDTDQAWALTSKFVKRIFAEIGDVRVIARDGVYVNDPWTTAAKFLFATLKAHTVMQDFMRLNIKDHPSISSEMVKFICYSQPAHDTADVLARLSAAESLMRTNQGAIAKLDSRLKKLETHKVETDKLLKKLKEHANL